jgi:hypothetical protein
MSWTAGWLVNQVGSMASNTTYSTTGYHLIVKLTEFTHIQTTSVVASPNAAWKLF